MIHIKYLALPPTIAIPPILHYSAEEPFTKYEMCLVFAKILGLPHTHIVPDAEPYTVSLGAHILRANNAINTLIGRRSNNATS